MVDQLARARMRYRDFKAAGLVLDMTRGKPSAQQLDLALPMLTVVDETHFRDKAGSDCRNYGHLEGLPEARALFADYLELTPDEVIVGGNASLSLMYDAIVRAMFHGVPGGQRPWLKEEKVSFLCPCPGYDRHFGVCKDLGVHMIPVPMNTAGPDMETVQRLVAENPAIKGMWCVPRYSNPTGAVYAPEVVAALAGMKTAAPDFRLFWDDAYHEHHLTDRPRPLAHILDACRAAGHAERAFIFGSTSKISFAGGGLCFMGASKTNIDYVRKHLALKTIGYDKLNQLRHVRFFGNIEGLRAHMVKHRHILQPKFAVVDEVFTRELGGTGFARWTRPEGGYFISLDTRVGLAASVVALAAEAGVKLTQAGATWPDGKDPAGSNIRIAPTMPECADVGKAMEIVSVCIQIASLENVGAAEPELHYY